MELINHTVIVICLLIWWYQTNAWVEYWSLLRFKFTEFKEKRNDIPFLTYPVFLSSKGWWGRLVSCPWCLCFWLCTLVNFNIDFLSYLLSLLGYFIIIKLSK